MRQTHRNIPAAATKIDDGLPWFYFNELGEPLAFDIRSKTVKIRRRVQWTALRKPASRKFFGGFIKAVFRRGGARPFDDFSHAVFQRNAGFKAEGVGDF